MTETTTAAQAAPEPVFGGNAGMSSEYLEVRDLRVTFDGFTAVDGVNLTLLQGDLRFLIGPNGAGKTTLVDAITGLVQMPRSLRFIHWAELEAREPLAATALRDRLVRYEETAQGFSAVYDR